MATLIEYPRVGGDTEDLASVTYVGEATPFGPAVRVIREGVEEPLPLSESSGGRTYCWARVGMQARELSRALLKDATRNEMLAERFCRPFTWELVSAFPPQGFRLGRDEVLDWLRDYQAEKDSERVTEELERGAKRALFSAPRSSGA